jgi:uncharacterized tellurite resistance protein B-like protein
LIFIFLTQVSELDGPFAEPEREPISVVFSDMYSNSQISGLDHLYSHQCEIKKEDVYYRFSSKTLRKTSYEKAHPFTLDTGRVRHNLIDRVPGWKLCHRGFRSESDGS